MIKIVIDYNKYKSYKDFYKDILKKLNNFLDFEGEKDLGYNANILEEFMWYNHNKNLEIIMLNFDVNKIKEQKTYEDYQWNLILEVLQDFAAEHPNNTIVFRNE